MIPVDEKGYYDLKKTSLAQIKDEYAARILEAFVASGGQGLRSELFQALVTTCEWKEVQLKMRTAQRIKKVLASGKKKK